MKNCFSGLSAHLSNFAVCFSTWSLIAAFLLLLDGAAVFARPVPAAWQPAPMNRPPADTNAVPAHWHTIVITPRPGRPKIHFYNKLNPVWWLENADEPVPPKWYRPGEPNRVTKWHFRNPFHNLTFYVIGIADKDSVRCGPYPDKIANPHGGWNVAVSRRIMVLLPLVSYQHGKFAFYFGWHPDGNFGIKLNYSNANLPHDPKSAPARP